MANFLLLYSGGSMPETPAEQAEVMQAWGAWYGKLGSALVDAGNPFTPVAKRIAKDGSVSDGPVGRLHRHQSRFAGCGGRGGQSLPGSAGWCPDHSVRNLPGDVGPAKPHQEQPQATGAVLS